MEEQHIFTSKVSLKSCNFLEMLNLDNKTQFFIEFETIFIPIRTMFAMSSRHSDHTGIYWNIYGEKS